MNTCVLKATAMTLSLCACVFLAATPASADKGGSNKGRDDSHHEDIFDLDSRSWVRHNDDDHRGRGRGSDDDTVRISIGDRDRDIIRRYLGDDHRRHCPPGLAKKNNGCMPPGIAKKYRIGEALPPGIVFRPVPNDLLDLLGPAPRGHQYVRVDKDVLLISEAGKKVIDAVTLLSAVGN